MEKEITTTNQTTALADSLIVVQQLPIIKEQLTASKHRLRSPSRRRFRWPARKKPSKLSRSAGRR